MQESYGEGVAIHTGPESCVAARKGGCEALTGERDRPGIQPRKSDHFGTPTLSEQAEGHIRGRRSRKTPRSPARSQTPSMSRYTSYETRESPCPPAADVCGGPRREVYGHTPMMYGHGQSDSPVVPAKSQNKTGRPVAEGMEGRGLAKGNSPPAKRAPDAEPGRRVHGVGAGYVKWLNRTRRCGSQRSCTTFTIRERLTAAYFALKRDAVPGVDGETWQHYGEALEANLADLSERLKRGAYRAEPVRRAYIAKADGRQRPLGIPTLEDKIVQRATVEVLNAIHEADFLGFSYGFRLGRSPHDAWMRSTSAFCGGR